MKPITRPLNALVSYHYHKTIDLSPFQEFGIRAIGDSGAFSAWSTGATIDIDKYADWVKTNEPNLVWAASLDVLGDADKSYQNYLYLRERHELDVIPTIHYGAPPETMDRYAADGVDYIGLGGMVRLKSEGDALLRWCAQMFKYAREKHPQMRFHAWGASHDTLVKNLPFYSCDSTTWSMPWMWGTLVLWDSHKCRVLFVRADGKKPLSKIETLRRDYAISAADIKEVNKENKHLTANVSLTTLHYQQEYLRQRWKVSAPKYGVRDDLVGTNIHAVALAKQFLEMVAQFDRA